MILLDSSLIVAYSNEADENHAKALKVVKDIDRGNHGTPVITDYIFDEVVTVMLAKTRDLARAIDLGEKLLNANLLLKIDEELFRLSWKIFGEQGRTIFSFADCTSVAVSRTNGISTIATFDEDFLEVKALKVV